MPGDPTCGASPAMAPKISQGQECLLSKTYLFMGSPMAKSVTGPYGRQAVLFLVLFFLICFGLGYPTLNRYDPRTALHDAIGYFDLVQSGPPEIKGHLHYRVLVPYLARPIVRLAEGRIGTWNAVSFGLLVVNSAFVATSAYLLLILGIKIVGDYAVALTGVLLYLLNFTMSNYQLSGLIDSAEGCLFLVLLLATVTSHWQWLPVIGIVGTLAKETFVPLSLVFVAVYWLAQPADKTKHFHQVIWIVLMGVTSMATVIILRSVMSGHLTWPWQIVASEKGTDNLLLSVLSCIIDRDFWYVFIWLLPLGVIRLRHFPPPLVYACLASACTALLLGGWNHSGGNVARAMFNAAGPLLNLSVASLVYSRKNRRPSPNSSEIGES